jgi:hypothetical protein
MKQYKMLDMQRVTTYSIKERENKVNIQDHFSAEIRAGMSVAELFSSLPRQLGSENLLQVADSIVAARERGKPVVAAIGGHVIKCGLQPVLKTLIAEGFITAVAMNGSATIHDYEIALQGATSEDVGAVLQAGDFGFAEETGAGINRALKKHLASEVGYGEALSCEIANGAMPYADYSLLATCHAYSVPATVHVAVGTDIIHQHPEADGAVLGEMSYRDFRLLAAIVAELGDGGVWLNIGSSVIMPEVFLKALSVAQNMGYHVDNFTTANFDMIQHYRPTQNVVRRPTQGGGAGFSIIGHHEINIPLLAAAILDRSLPEAVQ